MPDAIRESLQDLYSEIESSSRRFSDTLERTAESAGADKDPSDLAFISTIRETLGQLGVIAALAHERGQSK